MKKLIGISILFIVAGITFVLIEPKLVQMQLESNYPIVRDVPEPLPDDCTFNGKEYFCETEYGTCTWKIHSQDDITKMRCEL